MKYFYFLKKRQTCLFPCICVIILCKIGRVTADMSKFTIRRWEVSQWNFCNMYDKGLRRPTETKYKPGSVVIFSSHCNWNILLNRIQLERGAIQLNLEIFSVAVSPGLRYMKYFVHVGVGLSWIHQMKYYSRYANLFFQHQYLVW